MTNTLDIYRSGSIIKTTDIDESTRFSEKEPAECLINCSVSANAALAIQEGDYIFHKGLTYTANIIPVVEKDSSTLAKKYDITFESDFYQLLDTFVLGFDQKGAFPFYGSALDHLNMIIANANRNGSNWIVGEVDATLEQNIEYNWTYVRTAFDDIATTFGLEYKVTGKTIRMVKSIGHDTGLTFELGRGKGLHQIKRSPDTSKGVATRVYGIGGTRNIDATYRGGGEPNLIFEGRYVQTAGVTAGTQKAKEAKYQNDKIFPQFKGVVATAVLNRDSSNKIVSASITDPAIDFDLLTTLQENIKAKVSFLTGALTGIEFEISNYVHATKTVTIIVSTDTTGYSMPNDLNFPETGDKFTFYDIKMPAAYKVKAEADLKAETQAFLDDNKFQRLLFDVKPDEKHLRDNTIQLRVGDLATVIDADMNVNELLRFTEISYPLVNEYDVTAVIGNEVKYDRVVKLFADVLQTKQQVATVNRINAEIARRNAMNLLSLKDLVIDPTTEKYYTGKIVAGSIEALYLSIGAKATNFSLKGVAFDPNHLGNPNSFTATAGQLVHYAISIGASQFTWEMQPFAVNNLTPASTYYLYAKISATSLVGSWELSTDVKTAESLPGYYILQAGVLFPVKDGRRDHEITKGMVFIIGDQITAGILKSLDGLMFFNMNAGSMKLGDLTNGLDYNHTEPGALLLAGKMVIKAGSTGYEHLSDKPDLGLFAERDLVNAALAGIQNQIDGQITSWFRDYEPALENAPASDWLSSAEKDVHLGDLFYNNLTGYAYRFAKISGVFNWIRIMDTDIVLALQTAQNAQATANGKCTTFIVVPYTPYQQGDLWLDGTDLFKCNITRFSGAFNGADWTKGTVYDSTQVTIDNGIVTAGTIKLGNSTGINAGITGSGGESTDVRIWAGSTFEDRANAPYRVLKNGKATMTGATIRSAGGADKPQMEFSGEDNNIRLKDAAGNVLIDIDDDSAFEYYTLQSNDGAPPTLVSHFGPGIKVGAEAGDNATIGRKGIAVANGGVRKQFVGVDHLTGRGEVNLDVNKAMILKNVADVDMPGSAGLTDTGQGYYTCNQFRNVQIYLGLIDGVPVLKWVDLP